MSWQNAVGGGVQLVGLGIAAFGVRQTRKQYAPDRLGFEGWARQRWWWFRRTILRRPYDHNLDVHDVHHAQTVESALPLGIGYGSLPDSMTLDERVAALDSRTRDQREALNALGWSLAEEREQRTTVVARINATLAAEADQRRSEIASAMASGLRLESIGLGIAAVGTAVAAFG